MPRSKPKVRDVAVKWLCQIAGHVDRARRLPAPQGAPGTMTAGLPYQEVLARVRAECGPRASMSALYVYANAIREELPGFEGRTLPQYRPRAPRTA